MTDAVPEPGAGDEPGSTTAVDVDLPPEVAAGVFADFVSVWHSSDVFTLDFASVVSPPVEVADPVTGAVSARVPARIVARVRIPPAQVFEIMKALESQLSSWERGRGGAPSP